MKPTIPETGTVIRVHGDTAEVLLKGGKSCKGCGAAKIGLCRAAGPSMMQIVKNDLGACPGDTVQIGIARDVQIKGYLLAYIIPLLSFVAGTLAGYVAVLHVAFGSLDVVAGFAALFVSIVYTLQRLKELDRSSMMTIKRKLGEEIFHTEEQSEEERRYGQCSPRC